MRSNTDRSLALSFDEVAHLYDARRPRFTTEMVAEIAVRAGIDLAGARVLEIGAGTGQLTDALLALGAAVTAVEPGPVMARMLSERVETVPSSFEEADLGGDNYDAIVSANAFHWVDPDVGHEKVVTHLAEAGALLLIWNFPLPASRDVQQVINDVVAEELPDAAIDRDDIEEHIEQTLHDGRQELTDRGWLLVDRWGWSQERFSMTPHERMQLAASYAATTRVPEQTLARLAEKIDAAGVEHVEVENRVYWVVARPVQKNTR